VPRSPRPDDLYRLRIATEPRLSPDGRAVVVTLQTVAPGYDGYRSALWLVPTTADGGEPRRLTIGARHDGNQVKGGTPGSRPCSVVAVPSVLISMAI